VVEEEPKVDPRVGSYASGVDSVTNSYASIGQLDKDLNDNNN
jgi:hypothetical protein